MTFQEFKEDLINRCRNIKKTRWIRFGIVGTLYLLWCIWMRNAWLLLGLVLLFDIYIAGYIPFTWWKKSKDKPVRIIMSWVDAIIYALILVYFIFNFIGQNYQIPSSSLEKTLLTGDYLFVNKLTYGPRVPMTPVHFPLAHNKMPLIGTDSYLDRPSNNYKRLAGFRNVELGDIVVFNFPAGDTVAAKTEEIGPDYYSLARQLGIKALKKEDETDFTYAEMEHIKAVGRQLIADNPGEFGKIKYRPVDRRINYVKRVVGLPGQRIKIINGIIHLDGVPYSQPQNVQFNYDILTTQPLTEDYVKELDINLAEIQQVKDENGRTIPNRYVLPLTASMIEQLKADGMLASHQNADLNSGILFPEVVSNGWTLSDYGGSAGLWIPRKGDTIILTPDNWPIYERAIRNYEGHTNSYIKNGKVYIDGSPADTYTFEFDYYFMMGDNRDNSLDSRFWGFVPEDHIVGTPAFVLISFDSERGIFNGGIRWNRIFRTANPDR